MISIRPQLQDLRQDMRPRQQSKALLQLPLRRLPPLCRRPPSYLPAAATADPAAAPAVLAADAGEPPADCVAIAAAHPTCGKTCGLGNIRRRSSSCPCGVCGRFADVLQAFTSSHSRSPCGRPRPLRQRSQANLLRTASRLPLRVTPLLLIFLWPQLSDLRQRPAALVQPRWQTTAPQQ